MRVAETRLEPACQLLVDQDGVEMHRRLGHPDALTPRRDAGMQVGEGVAVVEPAGLGHEVFDQGQHPIGAVDECRQGRCANRPSARDRPS